MPGMTTGMLGNQEYSKPIYQGEYTEQTARSTGGIYFMGSGRWHAWTGTGRNLLDNEG